MRSRNISFEIASPINSLAGAAIQRFYSLIVRSLFLFAIHLESGIFH